MKTTLLPMGFWLAASLLLAACGPAQEADLEAPADEAASGAGAPAAPTADVVQLVRPDGTYPTRPLAKDVVVLKVVQNGFTSLQEAPDKDAALQENLDRMTFWINKACTEGKQPDFILFNEFPLTGYSTGTREEKLKYTIEVPGPETDALGELAKACDTYIIFGSYARDPEWPNHIVSINPVIDTDGNVVKEYWKTRNVTRLGSGEIPTTTVENVRDKYRARYGIEEEFPVLQTEFGNIAVSTVQIDPFVFAAYAMRGVEIMLRTATGFSTTDVRAIAFFNNFYSAMSNITFPPDSSVPEGFGGRSLIVDNRGRVLAEDPSGNEGLIEAEIPIAEFRKNRRIPRYPLEVVQPVFDQYVQEVPLNHLDIPADQLPQTREDMQALLDRESRWLN
jgi:predicted amidohydrolase